ncbi:hypothetical protein [Cohaesibacter celericrescens]|uniref:Uncharacterized protein n=1 Tax=Cohaesibacter celericrescens TaxID=2067669 RepID=A0A2N5XTQ1_9HYPH|nr:hypothetical protein [Cohaesibacter celericrescens]PLW77869.1 hypothetical protein C0081_07015 [Cohaesibacter celericrescens]
MKSYIVKAISIIAVMLFLGFGIKTIQMYDGPVVVSHMTGTYATPECIFQRNALPLYLQFRHNKPLRDQDLRLMPGAEVVEKTDVPKDYTPDEKCRNSKGFEIGESSVSMDFFRGSLKIVQSWFD